MSEPMFPSGGVATAPPPPSADEVVEPKNNKKALVVVGAVVAVLVVVAGLWLLMNSGSSDDSAGTAVVPHAAAGATGAPSAAPTPAVVKPASVKVSKNDPFAPLFPTPVSTPGASQSAAPGTGAGGGQSAAPNPTPVTPAVTLEVLTIDTKNPQSATVSVDGKKYKGLGVGDSFGGHYTLYSVFNAQCVGVLYGDQSVPVCLNKPVSVTP